MSGLLTPEALFALKVIWADEGKHWLTETLFGHIDAMAAREAKLRELHRSTGLLPGYCEGCEDNWPCASIRILDGDE